MVDEPGLSELELNEFEEFMECTCHFLLIP
jgi:hypothetical protein